MTVNDRLYSLRRPKGKRKDKKITFYKRVNIVDNKTGSITQRWRKEYDCKAYVRQVGASEYTGYGQDIDFEDRIFMINHRENINTNGAIVYNGEMYLIQKIDTFEDNRRNDILVLGRRKVPDT